MLMLRSMRPVLLCLVAAASLLSGCVPDKMHQPIRQAPIAFAPHVDVPPVKKSQDPAPGAQTNHATVEFLDHGALADPCPSKVSKLCQIKAAEQFIQTARSANKGHNVVILTFIHGNENNASRKSDNYPHFEQLINCLNLGSAEYRRQYPKLFANAVDPSNNNTLFKDHFLSCAGVDPPGNTVYAGIYIGWRGRVNSTPVNLAQNAAWRIGRGKDIVDALFRLRDAAKSKADGLPPARYIVVGHSFGGLLLEQAATQIFTSAYQSRTPNVVAPCHASTGPADGYRPFTDLVVTINEAANSMPAKTLIEFLRDRSSDFCASDKLSPALKRPILVGLHSSSDLLTGKIGSGIRIFIPARGGKQTHDYQDDPAVYQWEPTALLTRTSTPANLTYLQNLCYSHEPGYKNGDFYDACDAVSYDILHTKYPAGADEALAIKEPSKYDTGDWLSHLRVRYDCRGVAGKDKAPEVCAPNVDPASAPEYLHVWNRTPYWLFSVDDAVVSGHNDFWDGSIIHMLSGIARTQDTLDPNEVIPRSAVKP